MHNLSQIEVDEINVSNLNTDSIITTDLTVSGDLTGLTTTSSSIFDYTYTPSTRTFNLGLANQAGVDYILITDASGIFQVVLFTPLIYPLLSGSSPILYDNTTGVFSLDTTIAQNETFTGLMLATTNVLSTVSQANTINNTNVSGGLYYISLIPSVGSGYKSLYNNVGISYNITTTVLTVPIIVNSGRSEFLNGNNVQGTNYSAYFGTSNSKSGQLVIWDGLASNQYTQLACRSNVFIVQGNITSISLQKNTFVIGTLDATTGVNISTGQTYKINSVAINTDNVLSTGATNKYLNSLTATSPILYNSGTYVVSLDTTANIIFTGLITATSNVLSTVSQSNLINVTNTVAASNYSLLFNTASAGYKAVFSNANLYYQAFLQRLYTTNLTVSNNLTVSTSLNTLNFTSTGTFSVPDYSITNIMLEWSNIQLNGQPMVLGGTYSIPALSITNGMLASNSVTLPKIDSSVYSIANTASKLVQRDAFGTINVGGVKCNVVEYASSALVPCTINVSVAVPTTFPAVSTAYMGYYQNDYVSLSGATVTLGSVGALWDRVGGVNIMEVLVYSKSYLPVFKVEGQLVNFFNAPNDQVLINIGVFKNAVSTSIFNVSNCIATTCVNRNIIPISTQITPFCCFYQETDPTIIPGTAYTFTVCTQRGAGGVCNTGRAGDDIPSHLMVTQIA